MESFGNWALTIQGCSNLAELTEHEVCLNLFPRVKSTKPFLFQTLSTGNPSLLWRLQRLMS